jgi:hypothetical protein
MFPKATNDTPTSVGEIRLILTDTPAKGDAPASQSARLYAELLAGDGRVVKLMDIENLVPHLPSAKQLEFKKVLDYLRSRQAELLP